MRAGKRHNETAVKQRMQAMNTTFDFTPKVQTKQTQQEKAAGGCRVMSRHTWWWEERQGALRGQRERRSMRSPPVSTALVEHTRLIFLTLFLIW